MVNASYEFFPPKTLLGFLKLLKVFKKVSVLRSRFASVTGSNTNTKEQLDVVISSCKFFDVVVPHLVWYNVERMLVQLKVFAQIKTKQLLVVRGDKVPLVQGSVGSVVCINGNWFGVAEAANLVRSAQGNSLIVDASSYPDNHPKGIDGSRDAKSFMAKTRCGVNSAITQYFFSPDAFFREATKLHGLGVRTPVTPGLMCSSGWVQLKRMSETCEADVPLWFAGKLWSMRTNEKHAGGFCAEMMTQLCESLVTCGVHDLHFYTLNDHRMVSEINRHIL